MSTVNRNLVMAGLISLALIAAWTTLSIRIIQPTLSGSQETGWNASFSPKGQITSFRTVFEVKASTPGVVFYDNGIIGIDDTPIVRVSGFDKLNCSDLKEKTSRCTGLVTVNENPVTINLTPAPDAAGVKIAKPEFKAAKKTRNAPFPPEALITLFFALLLASPIFWVFHRNKTISQLGFVVVAGGVLLTLQPLFSVLLIGLVIGAFYIGQWYRQRSTKTTNFILCWIAITVVALLILKNFKALFLLPFPEYGALSLIVPLGTSYFLIRLIDLQLRWHRGQLADLRLLEYLAYIFFPPTIVAGPIELIDGFRQNRLEKIGFDEISFGLMRITVGIAKKLVIVDLILSELLFASGLWADVTQSPFGSGTAVLAFCVLTYLFAYLDFSAYSDIAIGLSRLYGHRILENFNFPILARNLSDYWKRWHISLSGWCFRNIFFPVMISTKSQTTALICTLLAVGMWHDLSLTWTSWGLYHGVGLSVAGTLGPKIRKRGLMPPSWLTTLGTNVYVACGFAFVGISDFTIAIEVFAAAWLNFLLLPYHLVRSVILFFGA
ncbi:MAG: MBOAT family O-acyltransferase [Pseudomonadota bacterium]